jgi:hypothetical protein
MALPRTHRLVFAFTVVAWVALCGLMLRGLINNAATAAEGTIDDYARGSGFQVLSFALGYLPVLLLVLLGVLAVEYLVFRLMAPKPPSGAAKNPTKS